MNYIKSVLKIGTSAIDIGTSAIDIGKSAWKYSRFAKWVIIPIVWIKLCYSKKDNIKKYMHDKGLYVSHKFKGYKVWDSCIEPLFIKQCALLFTAGNSFLKGMISDNINQEEVQEEMEELYEYIQEEVEEDIDELEN